VQNVQPTTPRWLATAALVCSVLGLVAIVPFFLLPPSGWQVEVAFAAVVVLLASGLVMGATAYVLGVRRGEPTTRAGAAVLLALSPPLLVGGTWLAVEVFAGGSR
jgi:VIT1/CCC1 family predicted Fe2+/Mn2+ transporter